MSRRIIVRHIADSRRRYSQIKVYEGVEPQIRASLEGTRKRIEYRRGAFQ